MPRPIRALTALATAAVLAGCQGWEGPSHWLDVAFEVGKSASACAPGDGDTPGHYPADHTFKTSASNWNGRVRAQGVKCITHTPPLKVSKAAWVECRVEGPALVTRSPAIGGSESFVAGPGVFQLRATRRGLSCRPAAAR